MAKVSKSHIELTTTIALVRESARRLGDDASTIPLTSDVKRWLSVIACASDTHWNRPRLRSAAAYMQRLDPARLTSQGIDVDGIRLIAGLRPDMAVLSALEKESKKIHRVPKITPPEAEEAGIVEADGPLYTVRFRYSRALAAELKALNVPRRWFNPLRMQWEFTASAGAALADFASRHSLKWLAPRPGDYSEDAAGRIEYNPKTNALTVLLPFNDRKRLQHIQELGAQIHDGAYELPITMLSHLTVLGYYADLRTHEALSRAEPIPGTETLDIVPSPATETVLSDIRDLLTRHHMQCDTPTHTAVQLMTLVAEVLTRELPAQAGRAVAQELTAQLERVCSLTALPAEDRDAIIASMSSLVSSKTLRLVVDHQSPRAKGRSL